MDTSNYLNKPEKAYRFLKRKRDFVRNLTAERIKDNGYCFDLYKKENKVYAVMYTVCQNQKYLVIKIRYKKKKNIKVIIEHKVYNAMINFFFYDRKDDQQLPNGAIEEAIGKGKITVDELINFFKEAIMANLREDQNS